MIDVEPQQLVDEGYIILRQVIPPPMLGPLRDAFEQIIARHWPDGIPDGPFQPRIHGFDQHIDERSAVALEFCYHENTLGVVRQLMGGCDAGPAGHYLMCNPVCDHGPWFWHRDISPPNDGPLQVMQLDLQANGPAYVQWNIALYDDDVFWVVPRSHMRRNTEEENQLMADVPHSYMHGQQPQGEKRSEPLPGSICVDLKAGDAVVYTNMMLHWGSNYSTRLRRCVHLGYRGFGGRSFYHQGYGRDLSFVAHLSPQSAAYQGHLIELYERECDTMEAALGAILDRDESAFRDGLAVLHPGQACRFTCLIFLCKHVQRMQKDGNTEFAARFTADQRETLWQRFAPLDEALQTDEPRWSPGFLLKGPTRYRLYDMPAEFNTDKFVASWSNSVA